MMKYKRYLQKWIMLTLPLMFSLLFLLAGCRAQKELPFYLFEINPQAVLTVGDVRYIEDIDVIRYGTYASGLFWKFTGEIGDAIGVCGGDDAKRGGGFDVCRVEGDEEYHFLFVMPNHYVFGPYYTYFCIREDLQMAPPSVETVSSVSLVYENEEDTAVQVDDSAMIAALFKAYGSDGVQALDGEGWAGVSLSMQHKDFPFLQCELECCYSPGQEIACCRNEDRKWFVLPAEWYAVIAEHDFSAKGE